MVSPIPQAPRAMALPPSVLARGPTLTSGGYSPMGEAILGAGIVGGNISPLRGEADANARLSERSRQISQ